MRAALKWSAFFLTTLALAVPREALAQTFDGDFSISSGAVYQTAFVDEAKSVAVDTITAGGPYIYVTGDSNDAGSTVKLSSAGVALTSAAFIGGGVGVGRGVAVDPSGNPWVVGHSVTGGPLTNWVVKKYNPSLVVTASTVIAGISLGDAVATSIAFDAAGNAFVAGYSSNTGTGADYRIVKYSPSLTVLASVAYGGAGVDHANALTIDASGNVIVTGYFTPYDFVTVKFSSALVVLSTAVYDAAGATDRANGVTTDPSGNVYVTGESDGGGANYGFTTVKYDPNLVQQAVATYNTPSYDAGFGAVFVGTATLVVVGNSFAGATEDMVILEYLPSLVLSSSRTFDSGTSDRAYGVAKGTSSFVYVTGYSFTSPSGAYRTIRLNDSATVNPAYQGCAATNNVGPGQAYLTIQSAVDGLPSSLAGPACVVIRDGGTYAEQVTVRGIANNGWPVTILGDPATVPAPVVAPPAASTAAFLIANASVAVQGIDIVPTAAIPYGVFISSPYAAISGVNIQDAGGKIATAGVSASSWTSVEKTSVTVGGANATGVWLPGITGASISYSSSAANGSAAYALRLTGASSNTVSDSFLVNLPGVGVQLLNSNGNAISRSSIACDNGTGIYAALYLSNSSSNTVTKTYVRNSFVDAISLRSGSNYNTISQSTAVLTGAGGQAALGLTGSHYNSVSGCMLTASGGVGINLGTSNFNAVSQTTMAVTNGMGHQGLMFNVASSNTVTQCYIADPQETGISYFNGSSYNAVTQSVIVGGASSNLYPSGVYLQNGSYNTIAQSVISNPGGFGAAFGGAAQRNTISLSTVTSGAAGHPGVYFMPGSGTNTVTGSYVQGSTAAYVFNVKGAVIDSSVLAGGALGPGIFLDYGSSGTIVLAGNTITGARHGLRISTQSASLSISSIAFSGLAPGATAIHFLGGTFVATVTAASFDASAQVNVGAAALDPASRVTMSAASGVRAGAPYETDPGALVDWPGTIAFTPTGLAASGVGIGAATLSWGANGNLAGTLYELERSSGTGYGLRSSSTALTYLDATLTAASTYTYRVRAISTDQGASAYGSTVTLVTRPITARPEVASFAPSSAAAGTSVAASVTGAGFVPSAALWLERTPADQGVWTATGSFTQVRMQGAMARLRDGKVLLAGGLVDGVAVGRAETDIFDPATGAWTATASMNQGRYEAASAVLADGRVLVSGGVGGGTIVASAEIYDPSISTWTTVAPMAQARQGHHMVALPDGRVLAAGGWSGASRLNSAEIYDPAANAWSAAASMSSPRAFAHMILLGNGKALMSGDTGATAASSTAELYDPAGNVWSAAGAMSSARYYHQTVLLPDGRALVSGGSAATSTADIFDPGTNAWTSAGTMGAPRFGHAMVTVNGAPLVIGGENSSTALASTEIYDAVLNAWRPGPALALGTRTYPRAVVLEDGKVLAAGGRQGLGGGTTLNSSEVLVMPLTQIAATGVAVTSASALSGTLDLTGAATGYWDAVVRGPGGRAGRFSGAFLAVSTPLAPSGFAGAVLSDSSILWSWTDGSIDEAGFRVLSGTAPVSGNLAANTTVWLQTGLGGNAVTGPLSVRAYNLAGTADSSTATRTTFAAVPTGLAASGVNLTSGTVSWSAGSNSTGTVYQLERSTGAGYGLRLSGAATSYFDADLTPGATHLFRVLAINGDAIATAYSATLTVVASPLPAVPGAPGTPAGAPLGVSSVSWTWTLASGASSYNLFRSSDNGYHASSSSGALTFTGLAPNTAYGLRAAGVNLAGSGPLSAAATAYTLAADPAGTGTAVTSTTIVASWALNGNPASTVAELLRSTDAVAYSTLTVGAVTSYAEADLLGCTTYYYRVRNLNGDGVPTAYASFSGVTANTVPSPPSGLTAAANAGGTVGLSWALSPTEGVNGYRLYWDAGTGTVSYAAPLATLGAAATGYTTAVLTSSASYTFALRAAHRCGSVETTGAIAMSGAAASPPALRAAIKEPDSGRRISGDRVTVLGELVYGTPSDVQQVLFQYKLATSTAWLSVPAANVNHSNPDLDSPYFVHWDVTVLAAGSYDLRAVAYARNGVPDPAPPAVRVVVDPVAPDIREGLTAGGKIKKEQTISNIATSVVETAGAGAADAAVRVTLPPGVVNTATATVSVIANPSITTAAPAGQSMVGSAIKIDLSNGQTALNGVATITLTYPDTIRFPSLLQIYYLDEATGRWSRDFATSVNASSRTVTGQTPHFSTFVLMLGTAFAANLDSVQAYPVPYKPNGNNPDEGRPFSHGDANSGIIFANLAAASEIRIYTMSGRLVSSLDNPTIAGTVRWDARNQDGREVASGAYFAVISAPGQKSVIKKLVIIR